MPVSSIEFDPRRALAALMYLVQNTSNDLYILMKMLYVADKEHLRIAGRFMAGDDYIAMQEGATPSGAYDLVKYVRGDHGVHRGLRDVGNYIRVTNRIEVENVADVPETALSTIAKRCLDDVIQQYREHPNWLYWYRAAHDSAWDDSVSEGAFAPPMNVESIARAIPDNEALLEHIADPYPEAAEG